jgi:O-antigen ligase
VPRSYVSSARTAAVVLGALLVAGNALVRGGVGLAAVAASAALAAACLALAPRIRAREATVSIPLLAIGLAAAVVAIALQLVPIPPSLVETLSWRTTETLQSALAPIGVSSWRPLSLDPGATALELAKAATLAAAAAAGAILGASERRRDQLLRAIALSGLATVAVYYAAALAGRSPLLEPRFTFVNPNHLAGFLQLAAWPALGFALRRRGPRRVAWLLSFAFTASGVFLSLSRAGIAAFFVAAGLFVVLRMRAEAGRARPAALPGLPPPDGEAPAAPPGRARTRGGTAVAAGVAGALAISAWLALDPILAELRTLSDESTTAVKLGIWPVAAQIAREFPLVGIGRGAFETVYPAYKSEPLQRTFTHVENELLQLPVELGALAGAAVVALFAWAFLAAARRRDLSRPLAGALAGAGALAAQNVFDFSLEIPGAALPFALVLGIASREMRRVQMRPAVVRAAAAALLVLATLGIAVHHRHRTAADARAVTDAPTADAALALAREAIPWHPADYVPPAAVGAKLVAEGRCGEAVPWLTRAMRRNPTAPEPHRTMAWCLARVAQDALAKREYRLAFLYGDPTALDEADVAFPGALLEIAPDTPAGLLAAGRILAGRPAEAQEAWRRAWESFGETAALARLAGAKLALEEHDEALALARRLQEVAPMNAAGYVVAARALDALGREDEAQPELELGVARLPGNAEVLAPLGARHLAHRRFSQAKAAFDAIVAREGPTQARKRILVARALEGQGRVQEALREAQVARDIAPRDLLALETFARLAAAMGRFDEAIGALEVAAGSPGATPGAYEERLAKLHAALDEQRIRRAVQGAGER